MRTTLDLTDESYALAKAIAQEENLGLGRAISQIIVKFAHPESLPSSKSVYVEDGLPVVSIGRMVSSEDVRKILEESE